MMPPQLPRTRIDRALRREEHVLPARLASRVREFARQRVRQPDLTETFRKVRRMLQAGALDGRLHRLAQAQRQRHPPVPSPLPVADTDLAPPEASLLPPHADPLHPRPNRPSPPHHPPPPLPPHPSP